MSMGGVDLLQRIQEVYEEAGLRLTSHPVSPLRSFLRERTRGRVDESSACSQIAREGDFFNSSVERARTSGVGSRYGRRFGTRRSCRLLSVSE